MNGIWVVFRKEVIDNLRDRRSIVSALSSSLVGPGVILLMVIILGKSVFNDSRQSTFELPVSGAENAPSLVAYLEQNGARIVAAPEDPQDAVRNGDVDVVLVIPEGYAEQFSSGYPAALRLVMDSSRQSASVNIERTRLLLRGYSSQVGNLRLMARGINPIVTQPLSIEPVDVATPQTQALIFLNMMPYFVVLVIFVSGMYVIIDTTAGERERGSLEPLLINPVARRDLVLGKLLSSIPFAVLGVLVCLVAFYLSFNVFPIEDYLGFQMNLSLSALGGIFLLSLPMIVLASTLQMIIATFTRSFKEAQTYVSFLPLIPAMPGIALAFLPVKPAIWNMAIPTFGQQILINQLMRGEAVSLPYLLVNTIVTLAIALVLVWVAVRLFQRERILFGAR